MKAYSFMRISAVILLFCAALSFGQTNRGELRLTVTDISGHPLKATVHLSSDANQYRASLETNGDGQLTLQRLPYGAYQLDIAQPGFAPFSEALVVRSSLPLRRAIQLKLPVVNQDIRVVAANTLIDPDEAGSVSQVGTSSIQHRIASLPGRSLQDLVNSQPGWIYEGNAVLHPRGSEYQTQIVVDGVPLTDNRSPSFGPEIEADDLESMSIYTAGIPAEYGRKLGGVVELNTLQDAQEGFHGEVVLAGGSFGTTSGFSKGQYTKGQSTLGASVSGSRTDRYLNPVVPQNYSNTGTLGDFSTYYQRDFSSGDRLNLSVRHELSRFDLPNEQLQQAAGQRETGQNLETMGVASYEHAFSSHALGDVRWMMRDNADDFTSNPASTPIQVFQHNGFREGYFKGTVSTSRGRNEWKFGVDSDNTFLREKFNYMLTDPDQFDDGTPLTFAFSGNRPDLEQSAFVQDLIHLKNWTFSAGLRWDHYQLLLNKQALQPRLALSHYFPSSDLVLHFSYDRVFQTPSSENILLSSSAQVDSLNPGVFLRLPVEPSHGNYYEGGLSKSSFEMIKFDVNYFRRYEDNFADDDQLENTTISFPIAFRNAVIYGAEGKLEVPSWGRFSGFASYSWEVGNVWNPVTGGLFLGSNATDAQQQRSGHFPDSQDQRNTVRGRVRYQVHPRLWIASGMQYDSGLPFEFDGDPSSVLAQYGQQVLDRIDFARGRIDPTFQLTASAGVDLHHTDSLHTQLQVDAENLTNVLDVVDFGGLFSGNAIGPSRSYMVRLTTSF